MVSYSVISGGDLFCTLENVKLDRRVNPLCLSVSIESGIHTVAHVSTAPVPYSEGIADLSGEEYLFESVRPENNLIIKLHVHRDYLNGYAVSKTVLGVIKIPVSRLHDHDEVNEQRRSRPHC